MARLTLLLGLILASFCACPSNAAETAQILRYENDVNLESDGYAFS